jgi:hypothetical protein
VVDGYDATAKPFGCNCMGDFPIIVLIPCRFKSGMAAPVIK